MIDRWESYARRLQQSDRPILVGPWRSEVGFEVLYWIPFLHAFRSRYKIDPARLIVIGRGGSAAWYGAAGQADLYEFVPVETARVWSIQASQQTGSLKQLRRERWETHVCGLTAASLGLVAYDVLPALWMYRVLRPWWQGVASEAYVQKHTLQPMTIPAPALDPSLQAALPPSYVAMRWYARPTWPYREDLVLWTRALVERVARHTPVVLIESFHADDHADIHLGEMANVTRLNQLVTQTPTNNLQIQSAVIAKASAYIGTYGGMAQGAMRWGVPTVALYEAFGQTSPAHLMLSYSLSLKTGVPFLACRPKDIDSVLPVILGKA